MSHLISQSEVDAYLMCRRRHFYAHGEKIVPIRSSEALNRGTIGHDALDAFFQERKNGGSHKSCVDASRERLNSHYSVENMAVLTQLYPLMDTWWAWAESATAGWEVVATEEEYRLQVPKTDLIFPFKIDLLIRQESNGKLYLVDHKFVQDFYSSDLITILPQTAKYVGAMRMLGTDVADGVYNMIRTRPLKNKGIEDKIRTPQVGLTDAKIKQYLREQFSAMKQIAALKNMEQKDWENRYALRSANQFNCRTCPFLDLCTMDLTGAVGRDKHVATFYQENTYGYKEVEPSGE